MWALIFLITLSTWVFLYSLVFIHFENENKVYLSTTGGVLVLMGVIQWVALVLVFVVKGIISMVS